MKIIFSLILLLGTNLSTYVLAEEDEDKRYCEKEMNKIVNRLNLPLDQSRLFIDRVMDELPHDVLRELIYIGTADYLTASFYRGCTSLSSRSEEILEQLHQGRLRFLWEYIDRVRPVDCKCLDEIRGTLTLRGVPTNEKEIEGIIRVIRGQKDYEDIEFMHKAIRFILARLDILPRWIKRCNEKERLEVVKMLSYYYTEDFPFSKELISYKSNKVRSVIKMVRLEKLRRKFLDYKKHDVSKLLEELTMEIFELCGTELGKRNRAEFN